MPASGLTARIVRFWKDRPRRREMTVTDITRMDGNRVCVGGYLEDGTAVRPVAGRAGPTEAWLAGLDGEAVAPFSVVSLRIGWAPGGLRPPHTEDRAIPANGHRVVRTLSAGEQRSVLERTLSPSVRAIFDAAVHADPDNPWGRYVHSGEGARSLGTIRASGIEAVHYRHYPERRRWDYRLRFGDESGEVYQLAVVDLAFRCGLDAQRDDGLEPDAAARATLATLQRQTVYLRIGLARGWDRHPDRCYLQITGVYGFSVGDG